MLKERDVGINMCPASPAMSDGGLGGGVTAASCAGCGGRIHDRFYLLAVDRQWHSPCLKCCECQLPLDTELTCFSRDGNIYCKEDYYRMFAVKRCGRCQAGISARELVMRARDLVYHVHCFTCAQCAVPLAKGDHFGMRDGLVYCRPHYELLYSGPGDYCPDIEISSMFRAGTTSPGLAYHLGTTTVQKGRPRKRKIPPENESPGSADMPISMRMSASALELLHPSDLSSSMESLSYDSSVASPGSGSTQQGSNQRTKRMRTSFKHHQLRTMKSYFAINQNPDAKDLKQLAQKTGLSKRVLQVWFQNARAKWRRNLMRQEGGQSAANGPGQGGPGTPTSASALMSDSNSLQHTPGLDDIHHHLHGGPTQNSQPLSFGDLY